MQMTIKVIPLGVFVLVFDLYLYCICKCLMVPGSQAAWKCSCAEAQLVEPRRCRGMPCRDRRRRS